MLVKLNVKQFLELKIINILDITPELDRYFHYIITEVRTKLPPKCNILFFGFAHGTTIQQVSELYVEKSNKK